MLKLFELGRSHMAVLTQPTPEALARRRAEQSEVAIDIYSIEDGISEEEEEEDGGADGRGTEEEGGLHSEADTSSSSGSSIDSDLRRRASVFSLDFLPDEVAAVGIITIEDVLEELLGHEIVDETDQFVDNLHKTRVNAAVLARTLPPHLRKALAGMATRMGPAGAMSSYHPATGATATAAAAAAAVISGAASRPRSAPALAAMRKATSEAAEFGGGGGGGGDADYYSHLPRMMRPSHPRDGSIAAQLGGADGAGAGGPPRHQRRSTNLTQEVQDQLHLLEPLLAARKVRFAHSAGSEDGGDLTGDQLADRAERPEDT